MMGICHKSTPVKCILLVIPFVGIFLVLKDGNLTQKTVSSVRQLNFSLQLPSIYVVTPTYKRATQMADLTRMAQTLMLVPQLNWIVVEDSSNISTRVASLLERTEIPYIHLAALTPKSRRILKYGRGVAARRKALEWLRKNVISGVLYFGDDDNSYDIRIFEEMRWTRKVSVWPVGLIFKYGVSSPVVKNGHVVAFHDNFSKRIFSMDMAGFSVNIQLFLKRTNATMDYRLGHQESNFLQGLGITLKDLEPKAKNCTEVLVWHTRTQGASKVSAKHMQLVRNFKETNIPWLYKNLLT